MYQFACLECCISIKQSALDLSRLQIWDIVKMKRMRVMAGHTARVGALAWNSFILSR